jgi:hypothetical protein
LALLARNKVDVAVIGAGAAGLMAAARAAERGRRTLILEKNRKPGVKILMSGGTRCNITHATDNRGIVHSFGLPGRFLHSALAAFGVDAVLDFFNAEGVATKVEETGKIFPVSNKATDVLAALIRRVQRAGAEIALSEPVTDILRQGDRFIVSTIHREIAAESVILTSGGQSYPGCGTTGDGYGWASQFGHEIVAPVPALVPLTVAESWIKNLQGITIPDVGVKIFERDNVIAARRGSMLFAHFGLSGPAILDVSRVVARHENPTHLRIELDFLPDQSDTELDLWLRSEASRSGKKQLASVLSDHVPKRLAETLLAQTGIDMDRRLAALPRAERGRVVQALKDQTLEITGTMGFRKAEVTAGGVALDEVDSRDMQSKRTLGLYIAGELLDLDGPIGGYNFQAAWSTGWLAGDNA